MSDNAPATYRWSFLTVYGLVLSYAMGLGLVASVVVVSAIEGEIPDWRRLFCCCLFGAFGGAVAIAALCRNLVARFTIEVNSEGFRGYNAQSRDRFVPWASMRSTKYLNFGGLRYVRVFSEDEKAPIWIPLFLSRMAAFEASVRDLAPEDNVLRAFFDGRST